MLSLVIPTLNAGPTLGRTLGAVAVPSFPMEVVIADGGSTDDTLAIATRHHVRVIPGSAGRGGQLARGAEAAIGDWLLFLHADTVLGEGWDEAVAAFIEQNENAMRAAVFRFALDGRSPPARRIERLARFRGARLGLPYGDQGLLMSRALYLSVGGFEALPIMEDVAMVRRIGKDRIDFLDVDAVTSAKKYQRDGYWFRPMKNIFCLLLYFLGAPPTAIEKIYR